MTNRELGKILDERIGRWRRVLFDQHATPALMIAVCHDHNSGRLGLLTVEEIDNDTLTGLLVWALEELVSGRAHDNTPVPPTSEGGAS